MAQPRPNFGDSLYRLVLDSLNDGVYVVDRERRIVCWNAGAEAISGYTAAEVVGRQCADNVLQHVDAEGNSLCKGRCPLADAMDSGITHTGSLFLHHKDGSRKPVQVRTTPVRDHKGTIVGAVEVFTDISATQAALAHIRELESIAYLDPLTEMANRRYAAAALRGRLEELRRYGWVFGVLMLDIDHFKRINDRLGHAVGDRVLQMVARTLSQSARTFDTIGRWGGEEFVAILPNVDAAGMLSAAERFRALVEQSHLDVGGEPVAVTVSIGATLSSREDTEESVLDRADRAMYRAKALGRNRVCTDTPENLR